ncbi:MBOAT, membrane-bound O-acyltransferase family-domain-containing protein [Chytridium lagenaria]|nr:MBOAT, membrane-bound O-acyltransferase family-domain-containing protein [Chytridium lagenaria]
MEGTPFRLRFLYYISHDGAVLAMSDAVLVASCFLTVPLQWLVLWGLVPIKQAYYVQHVWQAVWFGVDWPWVQGGFFCLHGISMLMKQTPTRPPTLKLHYKRSLLRKSTVELGALKKMRDENVDHETHKKNEERIHALLTKKSVSFPNNLTVANFVDYMLVPTLVYELEYPRTSKFRLSYFLEKALATAGTFFLLYVTVEHYILPTLAISQQIDFVTSVMNLIIPFMVCYLLIFFIIFECICNAFAELTCFADREFYDDWWNSSTFDEFARKWNKPVHEFLLRHVYGDTIANLRFSRTNATLLTFFLSSCFHELVFVVTAKRIRMYMFAMQMLQLPLIFLSRIPMISKQKTLGNMIFWFGLFLGPPLLGVAYCREHYISDH